MDKILAMPSEIPKLEKLDHFVLTVRCIQTTVAFYTTVLGMTAETFEVADGSRRSALRYGASKINLHAADHPFKPHAHLPKPGSADLCFVTENSISTWVEHLRERGHKIIEGPIARTGANGPIQSIYVRDPDLNLIEISTYD